MNDAQAPFKSRDVLVAGLAEELLTRYLVNDVTPEERTRIESIVDNAEVFDVLCALEDELTLAYVRGELPGDLRDLFTATLAASPARRRQTDEVRDLAGKLAAARPATARQAAAWPALSKPLLAVAALFVVAVGALLLRPVPRQPAQSADGSGAPAMPPSLITFELQPGSTRSDLGQANVWRRPSAGDIRLHFREPAASMSDLQVAIRPVGGAPLELPAPAIVQREGDAVDVSWTIPTDRLPPGDYLITVTGVPAGRSREVLASRFFSIIE